MVNKIANQDRNLFVGLDIGTSKVLAIVGEWTPDGTQQGNIKIIGIGRAESSGLKRGVVVNIEATIRGIKQAIKEAEMMANCTIERVYVGIAGSHINSYNSLGRIGVRSGEVHEDDIKRAVESAKTVKLPEGQSLLHVLPRGYKLDDQIDITDPLGMSGTLLEVEVHLVTCSKNALRNIYKCVEKAGLQVEACVLEQLASSYAVLNSADRELGVALVDIGGGTSDIAVFHKGAIVHTCSIPIAGDQVTNDLSKGLLIPPKNAEVLKIQHACAIHEFVQTNEVVRVKNYDNNSYNELKRSSLVDIVGPRYKELFEFIQEKLRQIGAELFISSGVVLTGGTSKMEGAVELASEILHKRVRLGKPHQEISHGLHEVNNPIYATSVGLLIYAIEQRKDDLNMGANNKSAQTIDDKGVFSKVKKWMQGF